MKIYFDHEKLEAYQYSLKFAVWCEPVLERLPKTMAVSSQLDRACTSVPLNIAEGNGKFTLPDRCRFFDIARGSAVECAACLDLLLIKKRLAESEVEQGKEILKSVVSLLVGLIRSHSPDRFREEPAEYRVSEQD